jgi:hypothetical protein
MRRMSWFRESTAALLLAATSLLLTQCGGESTPLQEATPATLPFIQDDYTQALTQARERKLPLFIDSWAPW